MIDFDEAYYDPEAYPFFVQNLHHVALRDGFDNYHVNLVALHEIYTADENPDYVSPTDEEDCGGPTGRVVYQLVDWRGDGYPAAVRTRHEALGEALRAFALLLRAEARNEAASEESYVEASMNDGDDPVEVEAAAKKWVTELVTFWDTEAQTVEDIAATF